MAQLKVERREKRFCRLSRRSLMSRPVGELEFELQCEFYYSTTVLVDDLAKVIQRLLCISESLCRIADADRVVTSPVINVHSLVADRVKRQIDVARSQTARGSDLCRVGLVEHVEETRA